VRVYDRLFHSESPTGEIKSHLNPDSLQIMQAIIEPSVVNDGGFPHYQFERQGYFFRDPVDGDEQHPVFNRTVALRDSWAKVKKTQPTKKAPKAPKAKSGPSKTSTAATRPAPTAALQAARDRYHTQLGLSQKDARILTEDEPIAAFFEQALSAHDNPRSISNWICNTVLAECKGSPLRELRFDGAGLASLVELIDAGTIGSAAAKTVFAEMCRTGDAAENIVSRLGLEQQGDRSALAATIDEVMAAHPQETTALRNGKMQLVGFFMGQIMRATRGTADPKLVQAILREKANP
jgi:glutaminyl-tRNA synthetase